MHREDGGSRLNGPLIDAKNREWLIAHGFRIAPENIASDNGV